MMHLKLKAEQKQRKNMKMKREKEIFILNGKKITNWLSMTRMKILMFCIPCRKYEIEGRFVIGIFELMPSIKQHEASTYKSHINSQRRYDIDCIKGKSSTVVCFYTGEVNVRASQSLNNEVGALQPSVVGALDIAVQKLNENQKEKLCCVFNTADFVQKMSSQFTLYPRVLELQENMECL